MSSKPLKFWIICERCKVRRILKDTPEEHVKNLQCTTGCGRTLVVHERPKENVVKK